MFWVCLTVFFDLLPTAQMWYIGVLDISSITTEITIDSCMSMFLDVLMTTAFTSIICRYGKTVFGKKQLLISWQECTQYFIAHILWTASIAVLVFQTVQTRSVWTLLGQCILLPVIQGLTNSQLVETSDVCEKNTSTQQQPMRLIYVILLLGSMLLATLHMIVNIWNKCVFHDMSIVALISITMTAGSDYLVITYDVDKYVNRYICRTRSWCVAIISMCSSVYIDFYVVRSVESTFVYFTIMALGPSMYMLFTQTKLSITKNSSKDNDISKTPAHWFIFGAIVMVGVVAMNLTFSESSFVPSSSISLYDFIIIGVFALIADINQNIVTYKWFPILNGNYKQISKWNGNVTNYLTMCVCFVILMSFQKWIVTSLTVKQPVFTVVMHIVRLISQIIADYCITKTEKHDEVYEPSKVDERTHLLKKMDDKV
jgi:hypothetical protein